ncbi:uncharacterized protein BBOV_IV011680 [Babesia bovis T2Bo]|uniref:Membrane protein, putative n=1 Tax=Babesia bovis TaxID=5865 RepID=A7ASK1_BABBO|nr:uncharacterized protein BBOV_IV011680 [Babesia bovis T2Bo]EDO07520.1 putative integral membrane protein [Babesia bovis T2Bo]|eukprot:XP_001611088.1 hypothetical protein [Babesia bovis T2Bo]
MAGFRKVSAFFVGFVAVNCFFVAEFSFAEVLPNASTRPCYKVFRHPASSVSVCCAPAYKPLLIQEHCGRRANNLDFQLLDKRVKQFYNRIQNHRTTKDSLQPYETHVYKMLDNTKESMPIDLADDCCSLRSGQMPLWFLYHLASYIARRLSAELSPGMTYQARRQRDEHYRKIYEFVDEAIKTPALIHVDRPDQPAKEAAAVASPVSAPNETLNISTKPFYLTHIPSKTWNEKLAEKCNLRLLEDRLAKIHQRIIDGAAAEPSAIYSNLALKEIKKTVKDFPVDLAWELFKHDSGRLSKMTTMQLAPYFAKRLAGALCDQLGMKHGNSEWMRHYLALRKYIEEILKTPDTVYID